MYVFCRPPQSAVDWEPGTWVRKQDPGLFCLFHVTCGLPWGKCLQPPRASVSFSLWTAEQQLVAAEHKTRGAEHSPSNPQVPSLKSAPEVWGTQPQSYSNYQLTPMCPAMTNLPQSLPSPTHLHPVVLFKKPATWLAVCPATGPRRVLQSHQGRGSLQNLLILGGGRNRGLVRGNGVL